MTNRLPDMLLSARWRLFTKFAKKSSKFGALPTRMRRTLLKFQFLAALIEIETGGPSSRQRSFIKLNFHSLKIFIAFMRVFNKKIQDAKSYFHSAKKAGDRGIYVNFKRKCRFNSFDFGIRTSWRGDYEVKNYNSN